MQKIIYYCKKIRHLGKLGRWVLEDSQISPKNQIFLDYLEYCHKSLDTYLAEYATNLQPYMIVQISKETENLRVVCRAEINYMLELYLSTQGNQEDLNHFEQHWRPHASENQLKRYNQSKAGKIVADYYGNDPELNIVQIDSDVKIFFEKEVVFHNKMFTLLNAYAWESKIYAAKTTIIFRGIRFLGKYFLIGKYKMEGVCEKSFFSAEDKFQTIHVWGNPVVICNLE